MSKRVGVIRLEGAAERALELGRERPIDEGPLYVAEAYAPPPSSVFVRMRDAVRSWVFVWRARRANRREIRDSIADMLSMGWIHVVSRSSSDGVSNEEILL